MQPLGLFGHFKIRLSKMDFMMGGILLLMNTLLHCGHKSSLFPC